MAQLRTNVIILGIAVVIGIVATAVHTDPLFGLGRNGPFTEVRERRLLYATETTSVEVVSCDVFTLYSPAGKALHGERLESRVSLEYPICKVYYVLLVEEFDSGYWRLQASEMVYVRTVGADSASQLSYPFVSELFWPLVVRSSLVWFLVLTLCWSGLGFWAEIEELQGRRNN